jgi:hypothetical protein
MLHQNDSLGIHEDEIRETAAAFFREQVGMLFAFDIGRDVTEENEIFTPLFEFFFGERTALQ